MEHVHYCVFATKLGMQQKHEVQGPYTSSQCIMFPVKLKRRRRRRSSTSLQI